MSELKYWLWLSTLQGLRPRVKTLALARFGGPRAVYFASPGELDALDAEPAECAALQNKDLDGVMRVLEMCARKDITVLTVQDAAYPQRLASIFDPPAVLFIRGRLPAIDENAEVAIVGTRGATPYGLKMANRIGYEITKCGGLVVSGLTAGIDAAGARGALMAGGPCVGVLGTAIDKEPGGLERDVISAGALVSEYPPGAETHASNFRARNRLTSGLSVAAVVVEAPARSGALLFADEAASQGREIFAVPSNADSSAGAGSNALIRDGAKPVIHGWDVLCEFQRLFPGKLSEAAGSAGRMPKEQEPSDAAAPAKPHEPAKTGNAEGFRRLRQPREKKDVDKPAERSYIDLKAQLDGLSADQLGIISVMTVPSMHVDDIIERSGRSAASVLAELTVLQIRGFVTQETGKRFTLNIKLK